MCSPSPRQPLQFRCAAAGGAPQTANPWGLSRRGFLGCVGGAVAYGGVAWLGASSGRAASTAPLRGALLPRGAALRLKPVLLYHLDQKRDRTSWRSYGGIRTQADVEQEVKRLGEELNTLRAKAEFPLELQPLSLINSGPAATAAAATPCDAFLAFGASGSQQWLETLAASNKPNVLFVRHRSGPVYLWYEIAHWRLLRKSEDAPAEPHLDFDDVVVDDYQEVLWRLRALYGLKNAKGTTMLAIGGLAAYSKPGQELGPQHAKEVWGYQYQPVTHEELAQRLQTARGDTSVMSEVQRQAAALLAQPNVTLQTDRRFVVNSFLALKVFRDLMTERGATNVGVAQCMGSLIPILDTPPCLVLSLLNDEGLTGFCHTDFTHTLPGVLLRWISHKPSFVCNSHFPHHGLVTLAHCSAPRKMNGRDYEPTTLMTHYESDYGAATKVRYRKGQVVTCVIPNLHCTKWFAFRGRIVEVPSLQMCRSQMDVAIDGDWRALVREMEGFHTVVCYGDYLRELGYAVKRVGHLEWKNYSRAA